jgi:DNA-binding NtrC family response regulator
MPNYNDLFFGSSGPWRRIEGEIDALAESDLPLVLLGPTGCGKSALAAHIHHRSKRAGTMVEHSLGSVPEALSYSAFLGHTRGAFTGAVERHTGLLESAKAGTLFLDEIGSATPEIQRLLLGLLEGRPFTPIGASRPVTIDVRLLFATNTEPELLVSEGRWASDFYYRLGGNFIRVPGLAARRIDILPMTHLFLLRRLRALGRDWRPQFSPEVEGVLLRHPWPGNVRQLQSVCDRAAVLLRSNRPVEISDLTAEFLRELTPTARESVPDPVVSRVHEALRRHQGNKAATARELGIHRTDLYRLLERHPRHTSSGEYVLPA